MTIEEKAMAALNAWCAEQLARKVDRDNYVRSVREAGFVAEWDKNDPNVLRITGHATVPATIDFVTVRMGDE